MGVVSQDVAVQTHDQIEMQSSALKMTALSWDSNLFMYIVCYKGFKS